jgi:hypothetical protein
MIALSHPGKMGDVIFSFPAAIALCQKHGTICDFYTSPYCRPLVSLLEYQSWINEVIVDEYYVMDHFGAGVQPWRMDVDLSLYDAVYHLGIQTWPEKNMIDFYAEQAGVKAGEFVVEAPNRLPDDLLIVATCHKTNPKYVDGIFSHFNGIDIVHVGGGNRDALHEGASNTAFPDLLQTARLMRSAKVYAGGIGVNSVLAHAFPNLRAVVAHPGQGFDERHVVYKDHITYTTDPSVEEYVRKVEELWLE